MRFVAEVSHRCSVVSRDCADVMRSSRKPDKRFRDADKLPKTMVAYALLAQSILNNRERAVAVKACRLLLPAPLLLPAKVRKNYVCVTRNLIPTGNTFIYLVVERIIFILVSKTRFELFFRQYILGRSQ